jgi:hypothetical protein
LQFAVGLKLKSKAEHVIVDAEDADVTAVRVNGRRAKPIDILYVTVAVEPLSRLRAHALLNTCGREELISSGNS